jgi:hypothetical protein
LVIKEIDHDLPEEIKKAIAQNHDLQKRLPQIALVYHIWKEHPNFTGFRDKLESCISYSHQKPAFGAYLHKALLNEGNKKPPTQLSKKSPPINFVPHDIPEWVKNQNERYSQPNQPQNTELTPEQKAELDRLLKALGEV